MGGPKRHFERGKLYYLTNETIRGQALFTPNGQVTEIVRNNLAWAADKHDIDLVYVVVEPDWLGMLVMTRHLNISDFMCDFEGVTAREVNAVHDQTGKFYARRYDCTEVEEDMQLEVLVDLMVSPHARGFVSHPRAWGGMSSWRQVEAGTRLVGTRTNRRRAREIRRGNPDVSMEESLDMATTTHVVELSRIPALDHLSGAEYRDTILEAAEKRVVMPQATTDVAVDVDGASEADTPRELDSARVEVKTLGELHQKTTAFSIPVGMETVEKWPPMYSISQPRPRRPLYLTRSARRRKRFDQQRRERNLEYAWAAKRLREGRGKPRFPRGMIPPHKLRPVGATRPPPLDCRESALSA
jgi:hypothetical protein